MRYTVKFRDLDVSRECEDNDAFVLWLIKAKVLEISKSEPYPKDPSGGRPRDLLKA